MASATPILGLPLPSEADPVTELRIAATAASNVLDASVTYLQGTISAIPSPSLAGRRYYATDLQVEFLDTGSSWTPVGTPTPIGAISHCAQAGDVADPGGVVRWLFCDGRAISRSTYANLFAAISTTYGTGNGSSTFNIPDGRARALIGAGAQTGSTTRTIGQTGGPSGATYVAQETHSLSLSELPSHSHGGTTGTDSPDHGHFIYSDPGHFHGTNSSGNAFFNIAGILNVPGVGHALSNAVGTGITIGGAAASFPGSSARHQHSIGVGGTAGSAHNNMQPFLVVNHIIKAL